MQLFEFLFPGTSSLYAHNQSCAYVISADEDKVVNVTFLEAKNTLENAQLMDDR